ncbi:MAG TPA: efflux RND transporter permease subunit [Gemmatimonadales bacterium]|nr:efflux RND transporter permease subunit [Gemmatimonadales bacterium]
MSSGGGKFKEFWLTSVSVDHPTSVVVLTAFLVIVGLGSYVTIPKESSPEIVVPNIIVNTVYSGVAPKDIETLITRPIEEELNTIADVKTITSTSVEGYSSINVEFEAGMNMDEALQRVREKVDIAKAELPPAAEEPAILEINFSEFPIMQVNVSGPYSLERLRQVAEDLQDRLEQIPSVLEVQLAGGLEREVQVDVDLGRLKYYGLAFEDVIGAIASENVTIPGGSIEVGDLKYLVRVPGEFESTAPIADIVVDTKAGRPVYVRDVATVDFGYKERDSYARLDGVQVVSLAVKKRAGQNIIETADAVRAVISDMERGFPPGTLVKITSDQSGEIRDMVSSLENNIISGLVLVVGVLLFVLGAGTAWFVGLAIPTSMLLSFMVFKATGITMNMVVLFSLILALGMLVDNAIVVVENTYRFREQGFDRVAAAKFATAEVAWPIIGSTATTLAAFLPMAFWPGIVGEFMKFLPITLMITLSASLFVALVIVPVFCALFLKPEATPRTPMTPAMRRLIIAGIAVAFVIIAVLNWLTAVLGLVTLALFRVFHVKVGEPSARWVMTTGLPSVIHQYERILRWSLDHRARILWGSAGSFVGAFVLYGFLGAGVEFFPENIPPSTVYAQVEAPLGTRVEETDRVVRRIEQALPAIPGREDVESVVATSGSQISGDFGGGNGGTHLGTVAVNFVDYKDQQHDVFQTIERMRQTLGQGIAGADVSVELPNMGPPTGRPVTIEISGEDPEVLRALGDSVVHRLERSPVYARLDGLESDMEAGRPELVVEVDREKAALYGLNTSKIGMTVRSAINGTGASKFRDGKDEYDITVRLAKPYREDLDALADLTVVEDGKQIPLSSVAQWHVGKGSGDVKRKDLDRVVTVSSDVRTGYNANAVLAEVQRELADFPASLPSGYEMRYAGQQQEQDESQAFLTGAFFLALLLIAGILVAQFDSVAKPLIIMTSVVMSTVGVLMGLIVFRMPFGIIMTGIGVISLAGVVVNNAIVLLDYTDTLRRRDGFGVREAIIAAGKTRFRPVWLTAITTVLGLVPLATGFNFDFLGLYSRLAPDIYWGGEQAAWWAPMAIAVIVGLTFATFLTLILVPVLYTVMDDVEQWVRARLLPAKGRRSSPGMPAVRESEAKASPEPVAV